MRKHLSTIILITVFFVGLSVLLYPTVSNYLNQSNATHAIGNYDQVLNSMGDEENGKLLARAQEYNCELAAHPPRLVNGEPEGEDYRALLDVTGNGMIGYLTIKRLGVMLPVYHGTSERVLSSAAGHLEGSSLPVGGASTHAVITGHRGLPAAKLFTDLDQLEIGDTFTVTTLNQTLTYEVDQIKIMLPEETDDLAILPGEDHVTLVTCTPYAVNTHRLLVRGVAVDAPHQMRIAADAVQVDPVIVAPCVAAPLLLILLCFLLFSGRGAKKQGNSRRD
ncbi:class C sortase [Clostridiaceae bacterium NSJ-31]|uniref:Class C sortase n=1 Tax=Ligaoa zhengdingensis TaxID=2763658 RepID=A0A926E0D7_9FIRM|nr:class C sortase [Ligaoa zhengdingensis]MBC8546847.1 class C sortase [Ligaoa zhengdingensis]